ncbi:hypothetical protein [Nocardia carnea]|uniref:hypothetical protein n=1 Tax=Nocardia carnea TaxID=37328 RepID=UPI003D79AAA0
MPYHAAYLYDPTTRERVVVEHDRMVEALACHDNERLVVLMDEHRRGGETSISRSRGEAGTGQAVMTPARGLERNDLGAG